eukprot:scaffold6303_cov105-Isochrysis_galbana.AAC.2
MGEASLHTHRAHVSKIGRGGQVEGIGRHRNLLLNYIELGWATDCRVHRVRAPCACAAPCADPVQPCGDFYFRVLL